MRPKFKRVRTGDPAVELAQDQIVETFGTIGEIAVGTLLTKRAIATTETAVAHGLGCIPKAWFSGSHSAAATIRDSRAADATSLYLIASSAVTVNLWVI